MLKRTMIAALIAATPVYALAQSASGVATGGASQSPSGSAATVGSAGSGAVGSSSASTVGTAGTSTSAAGTGSSMVVGGSAASADGKASAKSHVNPNATNGQAKAMANEGGGTWTKSQTHTKDHNGELSSRTKTMSHEAGGAPVKNTVESSSSLPK